MGFGTNTLLNQLSNYKEVLRMSGEKKNITGRKSIWSRVHLGTTYCHEGSAIPSRRCTRCLAGWSCRDAVRTPLSHHRGLLQRCAMPGMDGSLLWGRCRNLVRRGSGTPAILRCLGFGTVLPIDRRRDTSSITQKTEMASQQAHTLETRVEAVRSQYSVQRQPFEAVINVEYLLCP